MRPAVRALRAVAAQVCQTKKFALRNFMEDRGLEGVLDAAEANDWSVKEIAVQVLAQCCLENGRFNNFHVGFLTVMVFLNEQLRDPGPQAYKDLAATLNAPGTVEAIREWMDGNFR
jgi:hypothetical protein